MNRVRFLKGFHFKHYFHASGNNMYFSISVSGGLCTVSDLDAGLTGSEQERPHKDWANRR
jgi:hypothetical protein